MAISGQGAPGVRTELADVSGVEIVNNPAIIGGVVGFSSKGPLNEIIELSSTEDMDTILGSGFNNPKYNQGLYATRGILNVGGNVEFVRPYGEEVITDVDDPAYDYSQKLKTDAFMVSYNFDMGINDTESIVIDHHAATRWKRDGLASDFPGSSREIYTIQETIVESTNTNFVIDSAGVGNNNNTIALFAIMNNDPTAALRATAADVGTSLVTMQLFASMITIGSTTVIAMGDTSSFTANDKIKFTAGVDGILPTGITEGVEYIVSTVTTDRKSVV